MSPPQKRKTVGKAKHPASVPEIALLERPNKNMANAAFMPFANPLPADVQKLLERGAGVGASTSLMDGGMLHASARSASSHSASTSPATSTASSPSSSPVAPTGHGGTTKKSKAKLRSGSPPAGKKKKAAAGARPTKSPPGSATKHGNATESSKAATKSSPTHHPGSGKARPGSGAAAAGKPSATKAAGAQRPVTTNLGRGVSPVRPGATPTKKRAAAKKPVRSEESEVSDFAAAAAAAHMSANQRDDESTAEASFAAAPASPRKRSAPRPAAADAFERLSGTNGTQDETLALLLGLTGMRPQQRSNVPLASPNRFLAEGNGQRRAVCV